MDLTRLNDPEYFLTTQVRLPPMGNLMVLEKWEKTVLHDVFGQWPEIPYNAMLLSLPAKSGKTSFISALAAFHLVVGFPDSPGRALILFCANSREQADNLAWAKLLFIIKENPWLKKSCTVTKGKITTAAGGEARVIPAKSASTVGQEYSLLVADELHSADKNANEFYVQLKPSPFRQSLSIYASYAGLSSDTVLYRMVQQAEAGTNPLLYSLISHDPKISSWVSDKHLESEQARLRKGEYSRLYLNVFGSEHAFVEAGEWAACFNPDLLPIAPGSPQEITLAMDLGVVESASIVIGVTREVAKDGDIYRLALFKAWLPEDGEGGRVELEAVYHYLKMVASEYSISALYYDPKHALNIIQRLEKDGVMTCHEVAQTQANMAKAGELLHQLIRSRRVEHWGDDLINTHILAATVKDTSYGSMISIPRGQRNDAAVALAMGVFGASQHTPVEIKVHRAIPEPKIMSPLDSSWTDRVPTSSSWMRRLR